MTNSTLGIIKVKKRGLLLASSLLSVVMYAQTETEARKIRSLSNTAETVNFQKIKEKETPSPQQLMAKAKQMNIKYSFEYNSNISLITFILGVNNLYVFLILPIYT